jgi:hypothetical protein
MSEFEIKKATRQGVIPLISLYSESGCGKTYSALLLARGLVGPSGDIHMIDTESRRGSLYADVISGGYSVLDLEAPFTPARYTQALQAVYDAGAKVAIVDSCSHEWEGMGGILDMAAENESRSDKPGLHNWKTPKFEHAKFVQFLLRSPIPIICCIRAKYKTRQIKDKGKTVIVKDPQTSPIQAEDFIFESTCHAEILQDHSIHLTKCSHPELQKCFPETGPLKIEHGAMIAQWCAAGGARKSETTRTAKQTLWKLTQSIHGGKPEKLEAHLRKLEFLQPDQALGSLSEEQLAAICTVIEKEITNYN